MLGRYLAFAIVAISLDLVWGYTGHSLPVPVAILRLGRLRDGHVSGDARAAGSPPNGTIPRCLFVVSSQVNGIKLPWFLAAFRAHDVRRGGLGLCIPGLLALIVGYFGFASRVRGVYFAILTHALTLAAWNVFCLNNMLLCGTNGLTNFVTLAGFDSGRAERQGGAVSLSRCWCFCWCICSAAG